MARGEEGLDRSARHAPTVKLAWEPGPATVARGRRSRLSSDDQRCCEHLSLERRARTREGLIQRPDRREYRAIA